MSIEYEQYNVRERYSATVIGSSELYYYRSRIKSISSSDGRQLNISYSNNSANLHPALDDSITITSNASSNPIRFVYQASNGGKRLRVTRKDGKYWEYNYQLRYIPEGGFGRRPVIESIRYPNKLKVAYEYTDRYIGQYQSDPYLNLSDSQIAVLEKRTITGPKLSVFIENYDFRNRSQGENITLLSSPSRTVVYKYKVIDFTKNPLDTNIDSGKLISKSIYKVGTTYANLGSRTPIERQIYSYTRVGHVTNLTYLKNNWHNPGPFNTHFRGGLTSTHKSYRTVVNNKTITLNGYFFYTQKQNYNMWGNPAKIRESNTVHPNNVRVTNKQYQYSTAASDWIIGKPTQVSIEGESAKSSFIYNSHTGNLEKEDINGIEKGYYYHTDGNLRKVESIIRYDDISYSTRTISIFNNYYRGIPRTITDGEGNIKTVTVTDFGAVLSETDFNGNSPTGYQYDSIHRLKKITPPIKSSTSNPIQSITTISWPTELRKITTKGNYKETVEYNAMMQPTLVTEVDTVRGEYIYTATEYDSSGRESVVHSPHESSGGGVGKSYTYDALNRPLHVIGTADYVGIRYCYGKQCNSSGAGTVEHGVLITSQTGFDTVKNYLSYGNPYEKELIHTHQQKVKDSPSYVSTLIYRGKHGQINSVNQGGVSRQYTYKPNTLLLSSKTDPEIGTTYFLKYDERGNLLESRVGSSGITSISYDKNDRVTFIDYPNNTDDVRYTYDGQNLSTLKTGNNKTLWTYLWDEVNNLKYETLEVDGLRFVSHYKYDNLGHLSSTRLPRIENPSSSKVVNVFADAFGRTRQVNGYASNINYYANGVLSRLEYQNGQVFTTSLNAKKLPSVFRTQKGTNKIVDLSYQYYVNNHLTRITDNTQGHGRVLKYDGLDRLTDVYGSWGGGSITYNNHNDITSMQLGNKSMSYSYFGSSKKLASVSGAEYPTKNFSYDTYGNVASNGVDNFVYDDASQLLSVSNKNINYRYDGHKKRVKVQTPEKTVYYVYSLAGELVYRYDLTNKKDVEYINLNGKLIAKLENKSEVPPLGVAILTSPKNTTNAGYPIYQWSAVAGATHYRLGIESNDSDYESIIITATQANCANSTNCSYLFSHLLSVNNEYTWWIEAKNTAGFGAVSEGVSFIVSSSSSSVPDSTTLISPQNSTSDTQPTYQWNAVAGATHYRLGVESNNSDYESITITATQANCANDTSCSYQFNHTLSVGNEYTWWIEAKNLAGFGAASDGLVFNITTGGSTTKPNQVTTTSPTGVITTSLPTYYWQPVNNTTHYLIGIEGTSGSDNGSWNEQTITASQANCMSSSCSYKPNITLFSNNQYVWWVRAINNGVNGDWSNDREMELN